MFLYRAAPSAYRGNAYGGEALDWSDSLAALAQQWTDYMLSRSCAEPKAADGTYGSSVRYRTGSSYSNGQAIFVNTFSGGEDPWDPVTVAQAWIDEGNK